MNPNDLEETLRTMRDRRDLKAGDSGSFRNYVWREIRHRKALEMPKWGTCWGENWELGLRDIFPKMVLTGLALAIGVAWVTGSITETRSGQMEADRTARMLNLGVFSPSLEGLADGPLIVKQ
jgi:hypothetical protein